jgi:hypothetical protein
MLSHITNKKLYTDGKDIVVSGNSGCKTPVEFP